MEALGILRIAVLLVATLLFFIFTRRLSQSPVQGYIPIGAGIILVTLNLLVGTLFHTELIAEEKVRQILLTVGFFTGYIGQTLGLILLLVGTYRLVRSLQPHLDSHYSSLVEHALVGVYLVQDSKFVFINPRIAEISGYERQELIGKPVLEVVAPAYRELVAENIRKRIAGEEITMNYQFKGSRKNGEEIDIEVYGSRTMYKGRPAIHGTLLDISERKRSESALRTSEERFRLLANSSYDIISETSADGHYLYLSPNVKEILGYEPAELLGKNVFDYVHPDERAALLAEFQKGMRELSAGRGLYRYRHKSGDWRWLESTGQAYQTSTGETRSIIVTRDTTERKKMEEDILKSSKLESLGILAGGIAHDFNNILTIILGNVSMAKIEMSADEEHHSNLIEVEAACLQAKDLTQQLLTFSKGGAPIKKTTSIADLIKDTVAFTLRGSNVKCDYAIPSDLWHAEIDKSQMSQVINNLVINADQAMPEGGTLKVRAENVDVQGKTSLPLKTGRYVKLAFEDQGIGIPPEHLGKIFDPYFTTKQKGSGLGLATAYSVIKKHEGYIMVESKLGEGTTFYIYLPASKQLAATDSAVQETQEVKPIRHGRILLMDDDEAIRKSVKRMLDRIGYDVEVVENGIEAIQVYQEAKAQGEPFDVVLMDLTIPGGMGGKEVIKKLSVLDPRIKAIVLSGYSNDPVLADYRKYGFSGVVAKPFQFDTLYHVLDHVLVEAEA